jgi:hypothetical protein
MSSKLAKAMDAASSALASGIGFDDALVKASHDAMSHHALHAAAAARAGKMDEAKQHRFMHLRHALENSRTKGYHDMSYAMKRCMDHHEAEAGDELRAANGDSPLSAFAMDQQAKMHPAEKHFRKGGGFVPHPADKAFKEDYKGHKSGPKMGKK